MENNIQLRGEILEYSLILENEINSLLLLSLGIFDDANSTKLFGKKASITFKNKIDLLYDINILSKEENSDLELLMIFRNKFLHDISCNSFLHTLEQLDNGIKNKFKNHLNKDQSIYNEDSCKETCYNLFLSNIRTIKCKVKEKRINISNKNEIIQSANQEIIYHIEMFFDLIRDLLLKVENSELENENARKLGILISETCEQYVTEYKKHEKATNHDNKIDQLIPFIEKVKHYYGIARIDNNKIIDTLSNND